MDALTLAFLNYYAEKTDTLSIVVNKQCVIDVKDERYLIGSGIYIDDSRSDPNFTLISATELVQLLANGFRMLGVKVRVINTKLILTRR